MPDSQTTPSKQNKEYILEQIKYLSAERSSIQSSFLSIISVSLAVYGLILYHAIHFDLELSGKVNYVYIIMPYLFAISFYNITKYTIKMLGLDAYLRFLERKLNKIEQSPVFMWQSYLIQSNGFGLVGGIAQIPCFIAVSIFLGIKFVENLKISSLPYWAEHALVVLLFIELIVLTIMLAMCITEGKVVYDWCNYIDEEYTDNRKFHTRWLLGIGKSKNKKRINADASSAGIIK